MTIDVPKNLYSIRGDGLNLEMDTNIILVCLILNSDSGATRSRKWCALWVFRFYYCKLFVYSLLYNRNWFNNFLTLKFHCGLMRRKFTHQCPMARYILLLVFYFF